MWYYIIFCLATSISACITILYPAMLITRQVNNENIMIRNSIITYGSVFTLMTLLAPAVFLLMWGKKSSTSLINGLARSFLE